MTYLDIIERTVAAHSDNLKSVADRIWSFAEIRYEETQSAALLADELEKAGFAVTRQAGNIETAFVASYGEGHPVVAILGEFDALTGLSQQGGATSHDPIVKGGNGHGCGHNLLGTGALAAVLALKACKEELGLEGTIRYYGCPAEEGGGGKAYMAREGLFSDVDVAFTWHPWDENLAYNARMLATNQLYFTFRGTSAHAGFEPHLGRSALDAVELTNVGCNYLREHIIQDGRIHYAITDTGGRAPNVVQAQAQVLYKVRAPRMDQVREITERVKGVARGAAQMTGTELEITFDAASADLVPNVSLARMMHGEFEKFGAASFSNSEKDFATSIQKTFSPEVQAKVAKRGKILSEDLNAFQEEPTFLHGSTDVGDVSWLVPTGQVYVATEAYGTPPHTWQMVSQGKSGYAHKGMLQAGKVLAASAVQTLMDPEIILAAKAEHREQLGGESYIPLIPAEATPQRLR
ncbi:MULTISPECIES: amidohydrolase [Agrobacterium tumefaciens complex]|uniref:Aminobenzoyl-glutamate utilization protein B n=1 Tax=Agrobacterium tumefaciens TaxID=358 RepID=A0AAW8M4A6_AGRTU|nr:amidohydrolase [Agrobacterium tumefaciens]MBP2568820.1 aminobenzoyl-glutamate utilization protein B [Agrobacterium tumefaciens]MDP9875697.1 aminobenzoyl-glutamate utilization protein B [Agrobacterium tumefaciens]MDP9980611.1 aminobenzoyl-glutamate utilization protein B [Agrobacterium tumefaciens]MDR6705624.1 aminobenzoyl-glutamate utilization protein B [Agrobacterium tumefaciens]